MLFVADILRRIVVGVVVVTITSLKDLLRQLFDHVVGSWITDQLLQ